MKQRASSRFVIVLIVLICAGLYVHAFPWEDVLRTQMRQRMETSREHAEQNNQERRTSGPPPCPIHPRPLPQGIINKFSYPPNIRQALAQIEPVAQQAIKAFKTQALSVGVVYDQQLIWEKGYGLVNPNDPTSNVTADTPFRVGSISKALTTLMLYKLRDAGKVVLDDPVAKIQPKFAPRSPYRNTAGITWRSLASQNSGLQGSIPCNFFALTEPILGDACDISNDEAFARLSKEEVIAPMYGKPHYADAGYAVIGRALESVLPQGQRYEDYMMEEIFKPLGMRNSFFELTSARAKQVPFGYGGSSVLPSFIAEADLHWARPTGQAYMSVRDLQKFVSLFFQGDEDPENSIQVLPSSLREMLQPVSANDDGATAYGTPWEIYFSAAMGTPYKYWTITKTGSMPGYASTMFMIPELKLGVIVQVNGGDPTAVAGPALAILVGAFEDAFTKYALPPANPGNLTLYEGTYIASELLGFFEANFTVVVDKEQAMLHIYYSLTVAGYINTQPFEVLAYWEKDSTFRLHYKDASLGCLDKESGFQDLFMYFQLNSWTGNIYSATLPGNDPFYGWIFYRQ